MRFEFSCFALCEMTIEDDLDTDLTEIGARVISFHATVLDAMTEQTQRTELLRVAHKTRFSGPRWPWHMPEFPEPKYQLVPINQMRFDDLSDAQAMIEQAAVLQQKGVGV